MRQGEIVIARLDPAKGGELGKQRPVVVLTGTDFLEARPNLLLVCPLMSTFDPKYTEFLVPIPARAGLDRDSYAAIIQCRTISRQRILAKGRVFARCTPLELATLLDHLLMLTNAEEVLSLSQSAGQEVHYSNSE